MATIYIYDSNQWGIMGFAYDKSFQVSSVSDMVEKVLGATKDEKYKSEIFFAGDGAENYQSVGAGANSDSSGDRSLQLDADGNLLGSAGVSFLKLAGKINKIHLFGANDEENKSFTLMFALAKALGTGGTVYGKNSLVKYYGEKTQPIRRATGEATLDRNALRSRLAELSGK